MTEISQTSATVRGSVLTLLRLEGLAVAAVTAVLYAKTGASWWLVCGAVVDAGLVDAGLSCRLVPGRALLQRRAHLRSAGSTGAQCACCCMLPALLPFALIWANHIGVDRLLGYGLKYSDGFGFTHLGRLGKRSTTLPARS